MTSVKLEKGIVAGNEMTTRELIKNALDATPADGFTFDTMKKRLRVDKALDALADDAETLDLEDEDFATLKIAVNNMRFRFRDPLIFSFAEQFN